MRIEKQRSTTSLYKMEFTMLTELNLYELLDKDWDKMYTKQFYSYIDLGRSCSDLGTVTYVVI